MSNAPAPNTIQAAYDVARTTLKANEIATPDLDASLLLEAATGKSTLQRITHPNSEITEEGWISLASLINRRANNEPLHRIIGAREFYGLSLQLNQSTLVPRPETEILVDTVLPYVKQCARDNPTCQILDLGTGSGAIALSLLNAEQNALATGTDVSQEALSMAMQNARTHQLNDRFTPLQSNWFEAVTGNFDLIVSNPPYIATKIIQTLDRDVREYDPILALDGGNDGLEAYKLIASSCFSHLNTGGRIALEIGYDQKSAVTSLFTNVGLRLIDAVNDLSGQNRVLFFAVL